MGTTAGRFVCTYNRLSRTKNKCALPKLAHNCSALATNDEIVSRRCIRFDTNICTTFSCRCRTSSLSLQAAPFRLSASLAILLCYVHIPSYRQVSPCSHLTLPVDTATAWTPRPYLHQDLSVAEICHDCLYLRHFFVQPTVTSQDTLKQYFILFLKLLPLHPYGPRWVLSSHAFHIYILHIAPLFKPASSICNMNTTLSGCTWRLWACFHSCRGRNTSCSRCYNSRLPFQLRH